MGLFEDIGNTIRRVISEAEPQHAIEPAPAKPKEQRETKEEKPRGKEKRAGEKKKRGKEKKPASKTNGGGPQHAIEPAPTKHREGKPVGIIEGEKGREAIHLVEKDIEDIRKQARKTVREKVSPSILSVIPAEDRAKAMAAEKQITQKAETSPWHSPSRIYVGGELLQQFGVETSEWVREKLPLEDVGPRVIPRPSAPRALGGPGLGVGGRVTPGETAETVAGMLAGGVPYVAGHVAQAAGASGMAARQRRKTMDTTTPIPSLEEIAGFTGAVAPLAARAGKRQARWMIEHPDVLIATELGGRAGIRGVDLEETSGYTPRGSPRTRPASWKGVTYDVPFKGERPVLGSFKGKPTLGTPEFEPAPGAGPETPLETSFLEPNIRRALKPSERPKYEAGRRIIEETPGRGRIRSLLEPRRGMRSAEEVFQETRVPSDATSELIDLFKEEDVALGGSASTRIQVPEFRSPRDIDVYTEEPGRVSQRIADIVSRHTEQPVRVRRGGGVEIKTQGGWRHLADVHRPPSRGEYLAYGRRTMPWTRSKEGIKLLSWEEQLLRKTRNVIKYRGKGRVGPEAWREKDIGDAAALARYLGMEEEAQRLVGEQGRTGRGRGRTNVGVLDRVPQRLRKDVGTKQGAPREPRLSEETLSEYKDITREYKDILDYARTRRTRGRPSYPTPTKISSGKLGLPIVPPSYPPLGRPSQPSRGFTSPPLYSTPRPIPPPSQAPRSPAVKTKYPPNKYTPKTYKAPRLPGFLRRPPKKRRRKRRMGEEEQAFEDVVDLRDWFRANPVPTFKDIFGGGGGPLI